MPLKYACFMSYQHYDNAWSQRIIMEFFEALRNELQLQVTGVPIASDRRLKGGELWEPTLEKDICQSACMVLVFWPAYINAEKPYCAREYLGMEQLEAERRKILRATSDQNIGLIIPAVFRGIDKLPPEIKGRQAYDFSKFSPSAEKKLGEMQPYSDMILDMAERIADIYKLAKLLSEHPCMSCDDFRLPSEAQALEWVRAVGPQETPFVFRERAERWKTQAG